MVAALTRTYLEEEGDHGVDDLPDPGVVRFPRSTGGSLAGWQGDGCQLSHE